MWNTVKQDQDSLNKKTAWKLINIVVLSKFVWLFILCIYYATVCSDIETENINCRNTLSFLWQNLIFFFAEIMTSIIKFSSKQKQLAYKCLALAEACNISVESLPDENCQKISYNQGSDLEFSPIFLFDC